MAWALHWNPTGPRFKSASAFALLQFPPFWLERVLDNLQECKRFHLLPTIGGGRLRSCVKGCTCIFQNVKSYLFRQSIDMYLLGNMRERERVCPSKISSPIAYGFLSACWCAVMFCVLLSQKVSNTLIRSVTSWWMVELQGLLLTILFFKHVDFLVNSVKKLFFMSNR